MILVRLYIKKYLFKMFLLVCLDEQFFLHLNNIKQVTRRNV